MDAQGFVILVQNLPPKLKVLIARDNQIADDFPTNETLQFSAKLKAMHLQRNQLTDVHRKKLEQDANSPNIQVHCGKFRKPVRWW